MWDRLIFLLQDYTAMCMISGNSDNSTAFFSSNKKTVIQVDITKPEANTFVPFSPSRDPKVISAQMSTLHNITLKNDPTQVTPEHIVHIFQLHENLQGLLKEILQCNLKKKYKS